MNVVLRYRGREVSEADVGFIRDLIEKLPDRSRRALSFELCEQWGWYQANGAPRDMVCRGLLLQLHRAGHIVLPAAQWNAKGAPRRHVPGHVEVDATPLECSLSNLGCIEIRQVRRTEGEGLVESLVHEHHYLGYVQPVGEHLKYLVTARARPIGCFCWSSAPRHLGPRDRYIGWSPAVRRSMLRHIAYQTRFLILPWVRVPHLASHLLGRMSRQLSADWEALYAHPIYFAETFVDATKYRGTCYRAANWVELGVTTGRGKNAPTLKPTRSIKQIFGYPLVKDFRRRLGAADGGRAQ